MDNNVRKIKTYSRNLGKGLTDLAKSLLTSELPNYLIDWQKLAHTKNLHVEIGFGDGLNLYHTAANNPENHFLGIEVYANGVCNLLKLCTANPLKNLFIHWGDADLILDSIANNSVGTFCIFFPDPWPKIKHRKRRLLNYTRLTLLNQKLQPHGTIKFITDIENYFAQVLCLLPDDNCKIFSQLNLGDWYNGYIITKYHEKALIAQRKVQALMYYKKNQP